MFYLIILIIMFYLAMYAKCLEDEKKIRMFHFVKRI
jgi:hypothetical protein